VQPGLVAREIVLHVDVLVEYVRAPAAETCALLCQSCLDTLRQIVGALVPEFAIGARGAHANAVGFDDVFTEGLRVERPNIQSADRSTNFDALVTLGGTHREVRGAPVIGVAETGEIALGATIGDHVGFAYDMSIGFGPGVFVGDNLQIGATIGFGFNGITGGTVEFGWKVPTEAFVVLELSPEIKPMAYYRSSYIFGSDRRQNQNMSKTLGSMSALMPTPLSVTETTASPSSACASSRMWPPLSV